MNNKELLLIALNQLEGDSKQKSFEGAVKLVKAIFMAQSAGETAKIQPDENFHYNFYRWDYGPFDSKIYQDINVLADEGFVKVIYKGFEKCFVLTDSGASEATSLQKTIPDNVIAIFKKWMNDIKKMQKSEVLELVYKKANVSDYEMGDTIALPKIYALE